MLDKKGKWLSFARESLQLVNLEFWPSPHWHLVCWTHFGCHMQISTSCRFQTATTLITLSRILLNVMGKHTLLKKFVQLHSFNVHESTIYNLHVRVNIGSVGTWLSYSATSKHYFTGYTMTSHHHTQLNRVLSNPKYAKPPWSIVDSSG